MKVFPNEFFLRETTPDEVARVLKVAATKKASELYGISPKFVKISTDVIKTKLSLIINESFRKGVFPDNLKVGMVYRWYAQTIEPNLCYLYLANFLKNQCKRD